LLRIIELVIYKYVLNHNLLFTIRNIIAIRIFVRWFFFSILYICCLAYEWKRNLYLWFSYFPNERLRISSGYILFMRMAICIRPIYIHIIIRLPRSPLCACCINACCRNWIFPLVLRGKCVLHNAWIKTFYVLSDSGVRSGGGSVCNPRKENAAACYDRVRCRRRRASSQRHQSSASVLLLFTRRRRPRRSSGDESFVGHTLVPVLWYPGLHSYHLIPLSLPPHCTVVSSPCSSGFFWIFFFAIWPPRRNGATAANPRISDARALHGTPRKFFPPRTNDV